MPDCRKSKKGFLSFLTSRYALRSFFLFFIPGVTVVLAVFFFFYFQHSGEMLRQSADSLLAELRFAERSFDRRLNEQLEIAMDIDVNEAFTYVPWGSGNEQRDLMIKELRRYTTGNSFIYEIGFIRMSRPDEIYLSLGRMSLSYMFKHFYRYQNLDEESFLPAMTRAGGINVYPVESVEALNRPDALMTVSYMLPVGSQAPSKIIVILIRKSSIDALVSNLFGNADGAVYITDAAGSVIYAYDHNRPIDLSSGQLAQILSDQTQTASIDGREYWVTADRDNLYGWNYLLFSDQQQLFSHQYYLRGLMILWLIFALLAITAIAALLAVMNYKPIYRLVQTIPSSVKKEIDLTACRDELQLVELIVEQTIDEKRSLQKGIFISNLLWDQFDSPADAQQALLDTGLALEHDGYLIAVLSYDDPRGVDRKQVPAMLSDMESVVDNNYLQTVGVELYDQSGIVALANYSTQYMAPDVIGIFFDKMVELLADRYGAPVTVGMGKGVDKITDCAQSFAQAKHVLLYRNEQPDRKTLLYEELKDFHNLLIPHSYKSELVRAVRQGRMDTVQSVVGAIKRVCEDKNFTQNQMRFACYSLMDSLATLTSNLELDCDGQIAQAVQQMVHSKGSAAFDHLAVLCRRLCDVVLGSEHASPNDELKKRILAVIEERLCDNTLSLEGIADTCGITPSYLGRYFKKQTGYSPMQYVDTQRMDRAKKLLLESELPLKQIVAQVGYIDESNFIRKFKKLEGITPIKFRQDYREGKRLGP